MFFYQVVREESGCATYVVGCEGAGVCAVVDPRWEIEQYLELARKRKSKIVTVIDTHSHADHVSGARRLVAATGAELCLPEKADVTYPCRRLSDGDTLTLGSVTLTVIATPGHRPEHIALSVTDHTRFPKPWMLLTGDSLFVGDVARPDLAIASTDGAGDLYESVYHRLLSFPDYVEIYPGHVSGST